MQFMVSMGRIQKYLLCPEVNRELIQRTIDEINTNSVIVKESNYSWGGQKVEDKKKKEEESKKNQEDKKEKKEKKELKLN